MNVEFLSTVAVIAPDPPASRKLYVDALGLPLESEGGDYHHSEQIAGCKSFGIWPLAQDGEACFGTPPVWRCRGRGRMIVMTVTDALGRQLRDLRISVTDRCNFRCVDCMPREVFGRDYEFLERAELLTLRRSSGSRGSLLVTMGWKRSA